MPTNKQIQAATPSEKLATYHRMISNAFPDRWNTDSVIAVMALDHTAFKIVNGLT
jgi:hypothetical protein